MMRCMKNIELLEWDSQNFDFKVGQLLVEKAEEFSVNALLSKAKAEGYRLLYIITPHKLNNLNLFFDEKLLYSKTNINRYGITCDEIESCKTITADLYQLSIKSGEFSRYNIDPVFPTYLFEMLYKKWIENSINTDFATDVLVYRHNTKIVGLLTYKNKGCVSSIGIVAVDPLYQRLGIGSKLIQHYESLLSDNIVEINVVTQGINLCARTFYEKNGYDIVSRKFVYHLWL